MESLRQRAAELLTSGTVRVVIGYSEGPGGRIRPLFARSETEISQLVLDDRCRLNLAVYLRKPEVKRLGKPALVGGPSLLRSALQLAAENHFLEGDAVFLVPGPAGEAHELSTISDIEQFLKQPLPEPGPPAYPVDVGAMDVDARWEFWQEEFGRCIKCYACRASCPLCYCEQCLVESNQPQWIPVAAHRIGNFEWHVSRAMHLAGRCVGCGACAEACPVEIPLSLINQFLTGLVGEKFKQGAGFSAKLDYPLSTYDAAEKEDFIR